MTDAEKLERVRRVAEKFEGLSGSLEDTFVTKAAAIAIRHALGEPCDYPMACNA